jgi:hypothetical protein
MLSSPPPPKSSASTGSSSFGDEMTGVTKRAGSVPPAAPASAPRVQASTPVGYMLKPYEQESGVSPRPTAVAPRTHASHVSRTVSSPEPAHAPEPVHAPDQPSASARSRMPAPAPGEAPPSFKADVEELLPLPDATQSLPHIPLAAVFPLGTELEKKAEGRSLFQVLAFAFVVLASMVPVLRYTGVLGGNPHGERAQNAPQASVSATIVPTPKAPPVAPVAPAPSAAPAPAQLAPRVLPGPSDPVSAAVARIEAMLPASPGAASDTLVAEALRALDAGEERLAETLLGRALKLDEQNPRAAYALARIRLAQNNLEGAEGWVLVALRLRPKRAEYHALYAEVLAKQGHTSHAKRERRKARELRN